MRCLLQFWGTKDVKNIRRILDGLTSVLLVATIFVVVGLLAPRRIIMFFTHESEIIAAGAQYLQIILISYLFTAVSFIYNFAYRSIGNSFQPMLISLVALFCNAFFNYVLICGKLGAPAMGVAGVAVATVIAGWRDVGLSVSGLSSPGALTASLVN